jgi:hypothetical protein
MKSVVFKDKVQAVPPIMVRILTFLRKGVRKRSELPAQSLILLYKVVTNGFHGLKQHGEWEEKELSKPVFT